jgi:hypothetical protein
MKTYLQIVNEKYHQMSFSDIDIIRQEIISGKVGLIIKRQRKMLYLNQMLLKYRFILKRVQDVSYLGLFGTVVFLFVNWKISVLLFTISIFTGIFVSKTSLTFIAKNCVEDRAFLKFALTVGLVEVQEKEPTADKERKRHAKK